VANVNITPQNVLLTGTQSVTFEATDAQGNSLPVTWTLTPAAVGTIAPAGGPFASITYNAPQQISDAQTLTISAIAAGGSASATIFLTPIVVEIIPAAVELRETQVQQFNASVAGYPAPTVTWNLSPQIGTVDRGLYTAPPVLLDGATVSVIATSTLGNQTGKATVTLVPPPLGGWRRNLIGAFLLLLFLLDATMLVLLWPPPVPETADLVKAVNARVAAGKITTDKTAALQKAEENLNASIAAGAKVPASATDQEKASAKAKVDAAQKEADRAKAEKEKAEADLTKKTELERAEADKVATAKSDCVQTFFGALSREFDFLLLVLLGGALGSFVHTARSYVDFVGNQRLRGNWAWWYFLYPFMGAGLALIFYMGVRGGFLASGASGADINPFGITSIGGLVGMFSKQATAKLAELFETAFKTSKPTVMKDALGHSAQTSAPGGATNSADQTRKS
jgi:hypothetical protein